MIPVAIIGAGPAGLMAALQLRRYEIDILLVEADRVGGLLHNANRVENYPGFPGGAPGVELVRRFEAQAHAAGVEVTRDEVTELDYTGESFTVRTKRHVWNARRAVVASGTKSIPFPAGLVRADSRSHVYYEVAPLLGISGSSVAIVGAGDAAFDYALNLAQRNEVTILNRSDNLRCLPLLWQRASESEHITYRANTTLNALQASPQGLRLNCQDLHGENELDIDYLIGALGRKPRMEFLTPRLLEQAERLEASGDLYFIGDVCRGRYRQTAIAVGDGMLAAMKIYQAMQEEI